MTKKPFALHGALVAILMLSMTACSSGSGGPTALSKIPLTPTAVAVTITNPNAAAIDTTDETFTIAGTATSKVGVTSVSWHSDQGEQGTASGTDTWQVDGVPLAMGANTITVTATSAAGETSADQITINRESAGAGSVTLSWVAPTERTDGTPLQNLAGYRIAYGRMSGIYDYEIDVPNPGIVTYVVEGLVPGDWYFTLTAYDASNLESDHSNEVSRTVQ